MFRTFIDLFTVSKDCFHWLERRSPTFRRMRLRQPCLDNYIEYVEFAGGNANVIRNYETIKQLLLYCK